MDQNGEIDMKDKVTKRQKLIEEEQLMTISDGSPMKKRDRSQQQLQKTQKQKKKFSWPIYANLLKYTLNHWFMAFLGFSLNIVEAVLISLIPLKVGIVLDLIRDDETQQKQQQFNVAISNLGYIVMSLGLVNFVRYFIMQLLQQKISMDMRTQIYQKFMKNDIAFFEKHKSGQLVSRLGSDINQAKSAISNNLTFMLRNLLTIISNIIILLFMSWKLTFLILLMIPFYTFVTLQYSKKNKIFTREIQDILAQMSQHVSEKATGIQIVKAFGTVDLQVAKYQSINEKSYYVSRKKIFWSTIHTTLSHVLPNLSTLLVLWYGGRQILGGDKGLTPGELTSFIMYTATLSHGTSAISNSYTNIINGTHAIQKVFEMMDYQPDLDEQAGEDYKINGEILFDNVSFQYPSADSPIIKNFTLNVHQGEYLGIVGQSGSGKSTIIKLIERFYKLKSGTIYFGSENSQKISIKSIRSQIGLVSQEATLFTGTIQENITYGLNDYTIAQLEEVALKAGCLEFVSNTKLFPYGFKTQIGERGSQLSGGQRQRIAIARALMRNPKILIFDEATSALDANSETMVQRSIEGLSKMNSQLTIIVIAHRLSTVINASRIVVMKQGEIIEVGSHRTLRAKGGYYYQLVQKQLHEQPISELITQEPQENK